MPRANLLYSPRNKILGTIRRTNSTRNLLIKGGYAGQRLGYKTAKLLGLTKDQTETVFYFPGCGSERLFSQVGLATLAMLYEVGVQTVLPPGYLCCGYPQAAGGDKEKGQAISTQNSI